jgi:hypothetical protein
MQFLDWENYVRPAELAVAAHKARSAATFAAQKARIGELCRVLRPPIVVCMGAGYLNDIPLDPRAEALLPLPDHSVDLITSSLVTSQFDFEPYTFFIRNLFQHFGRQAVERDVDALNALVETLRDRLFVAQLEGHCAEMLRLLKPGGRIYFSIEAQHSSDSTEFFLQPDVFCKAMSIIGRHFCFDLQTLPEIVVPVRTPMVEGGESIVQSYLLAARQSRRPGGHHGQRANIRS